MVIDDLDRCLPDTVIATLEAIKLFLFVPRSAFIIGADERLVRYAVRRRFPELPGESASVGRDYLEKLIQFPVRIPRLARAEIQTYSSLLFAQAAGYSTEDLEPARAWIRGTENLSKGRAFGVDEAKSCLGEPEKEFAENLALASRLAPLLAEMSSCNPRQVKRFLNTMRMRVQMAASRGVTLKNDVLAKLMLLEEFRLAAFKELAQAQADAGGTPRFITRLESGSEDGRKPKRKLAQRGKKDDPAGEEGSSDGKAPTSAGSHSQEMPSWRDDPWLMNWVAFQPPLAGEDLRPYFYVSRDVLGPISGSTQRLSSEAQEYLLKVLHESDAVRKTAISRAGDLLEGDAAAIFEDLASRALTEGDRAADNSAFHAMLAFCGVRTQLVGNLVSSLESFAENALPMSVAPELAKVCKGTPSEQATKALLERWNKSGVATLKRAAGNALKKLS